MLLIGCQCRSTNFNETAIKLILFVITTMMLSVVKSTFLLSSRTTTSSARRYWSSSFQNMGCQYSSPARSERISCPSRGICYVATDVSAARTKAAATAIRRTRLFSTTTPSSSSSETETEAIGSSSSDNLQTKQNHPIVGIEWVQDTVVEVLNELYDYKEVARGQAMTKIKKQQQQQLKGKNKKKNKTEDDIPTDTNVEDLKVLTDDEIDAIVQQAVEDAKPFDRSSAAVTPATKPEFGDYQINAAMGLAQALGGNPKEFALQIVNALYVKSKIPNSSSDKYIQEPEIAGPGFINIKLDTVYLRTTILAMAADASHRVAVPKKATRQKIIVDFSSPNIAKEMHVGHLRSTIIGDTICSVLEFCGHEVVRLNHVGDWGTQFGMLVEHLRDEFPQALDAETSKSVQLGDLVQLYKAAKKRFDVDDEFKQRAREGVVKLQAGNPEELAAWETLCAASRGEYQKIYDVLNIQGLTERGESFYNPFLNDVVQDLEKLGLAVPSDGAMAVFLDGYANRDGTPLPMLVRKSDGGFNYATTDLAAIRHRTSMPKDATGEEADRVLYVTDAGQAQHFEMVFDAAKKAKFVPDGVSLEHVPFGLVQGADGKKFATRSGDTVKLKDLLEEAVKIAGEDLRTRNEENVRADPTFADRVDRVSRIVGIGAVKYADLSMNRESNYRFSYERMLSLNGNTAPYMLYAYARICGIIRKASGQEDTTVAIDWPPAASEIILSHESETELIRNLVKLSDVIYDVERDLYPHRICEYLFDTSQKFSKFYESCSVNNAETPELKASRLTLCTATAGTLRLLLTLLGIEVVEKL